MDIGVETNFNVWLRLITSIVFLFVAIKIIGIKKILGPFIFGMFIMCDIFLLDWETDLSKYIYYSFHCVTMVFLVFYNLKKLIWSKITWFEIISAVVFLCLCSWILLTLRNYFQTNDTVFEILFIINGFLVVLLLVFAFIISVISPKNSTAYFFFGILSLIVSELILFSIYYIELEALRYIDNFFYVIALYFLLKASFENRIIKETPSSAVDRIKELSNSESLKTYK